VIFWPIEDVNTCFQVIDARLVKKNPPAKLQYDYQTAYKKMFVNKKLPAFILQNIK